MTRRSCDGTGLLAAFRAAVAHLERHVDEVNGLNVFPVPDGDTGSNMLATVRAALAEADAIADDAERGAASRVAGAISLGALMGARGNSGVITSQVFRGMADGLAGKRRFNGLDLAHALSQGTKTAYAAVARPVEGTILTVLRDASEAAVAAAEHDNDIEIVLAAIVDAAEKSVARTPSLLPILRESGVVDSGGQGLYRLLQGALLHVVGEAPPLVEVAGGAHAPAAVSTLVAHADEGFGYETMFLLSAPANGSLDVDAIRAYLETIGDSVLVAGDARTVKVHVHTDRPDLVIGYGLGLGSLSRISVENLDDQARDVRETRAAAFTASQDAPPPADAPAPPDTPGEERGHASRDEEASTTVALSDRGNGSRPPTAADRVPAGEEPAGPLPLAVIAVAPGEGLARIFRDDFGVAAVVSGGQAANPSTGELLEAVESVAAQQVLLLPNNRNVLLAARQVADMSNGRVVVVPTRNAAEGYAALLAFDPSRDAAANVEPMTRRSRALRTLSVTDAVRDANIGGRKVKRGQTIVLDADEGLVAADRDRERAVLTAIRSLDPGIELVSIYYGHGADLDEAEALAHRIGEALPGVEVEVFHGGQPHYRYLISAE